MTTSTFHSALHEDPESHRSSYPRTIHGGRGFTELRNCVDNRLHDRLHGPAYCNTSTRRACIASLYCGPHTILRDETYARLEDLTAECRLESRLLLLQPQSRNAKNEQTMEQTNILSLKCRSRASAGSAFLTGAPRPRRQRGPGEPIGRVSN